MRKSYLFLIILVFLFYHWVASAGSGIFYPEYNNSELYNDLTQSLIEGKLYLPYDPKPELLALSNPYDPMQNQAYRVHDTSLYKGKYFLYFGITPLITLYIPYLLVFNERIPSSLAILIFSFIGYVFSVLLLAYLRKKYFKDLSDLIFIPVILMLAVGNITCWLMNRPSFYEVAISSGFCFLTAAIYFLFLGRDLKCDPFLLSASSLFFGLAFGARPSLIPACIISLSLCSLKILLDKKLKINNKIMSLSAVLLPFLACIFGTALYNYLRFDDPFEFGMRYQLTGDNVIRTFGLNGIIGNLYLYLFKPLVISRIFPFLHVGEPVIPSFIPKPDFFVAGPIVGFPCVIPFFYILLLSPTLFLIHKVSKKSWKLNIRFDIKNIQTSITSIGNEITKQFNFEFFVISLSALSNFTLLLLWWTGGQMRFMPDFATLFIITITLVWCFFLEAIPKGIIKSILLTTGVTLSTISIIIGFFFSFNSEYGGFSNRNHTKYKEICGMLDSLTIHFHNIKFWFKK